MITLYYDFADADVRSKYPELARTVDENYGRLPLVSVDGQVTSTGYVDHRAIVQVIEGKRQAQG